jgi:hypothetical protein
MLYKWHNDYQKREYCIIVTACASFDLFKAMKIEENNLNKRLKFIEKFKV